MVTQTVPLIFRRRYPFGVGLVAGASAILYNALNIPPQPFTEVLPLLLAFYTVAAYARRDLAIFTAVAGAVAMIVVNLPFIAGHQDFKELILPPVLFGAAWLMGDNARYRRWQVGLLEERAEQADREGEERARLGALEERARIAREIHDVVAHSVSVMAIQAGAARTVVEEQPEKAREALASIEALGRETTAELRRAVGILRGARDEEALVPQPGLEGLGELVDHFRRSGLSVDVSTEGVGQGLPPGLDLSAYRVVQEALTNTLKHAGSAQAHVLVRYDAEALEIVVLDEGSAQRPAGTGPGGREGRSGQGLIGMRERVAMFDGTLEAGPAEGGFCIKARFPLRVETEAGAQEPT